MFWIFWKRMKNKEPVYIFLRPYENVAILTNDGKMVTRIVRQEKDLQEYGDVLQEIMIDVMKNPTAKNGMWLWKISDNWSSVAGWEIEE